MQKFTVEFITFDKSYYLALDKPLLEFLKDSDSIYKFLLEEGGFNIMTTGSFYKKVNPEFLNNPLKLEHADLDLSKFILLNHKKLSYIKLGNSEYNELILLTLKGNGLGDNEYKGTCLKKVGSWAGDFISIKAIEGFQNIIDLYKEEKVVFNDAI